MGAAAMVDVASGGAVRIPTGGMLPSGADAVVMQEQTDLDGAAVRVGRGVRPGENIVARGRARVRTIMTAGHTRQHLEQALEAFARAGRSLGVI